MCGMYRVFYKTSFTCDKIQSKQEHRYWFKSVISLTFLLQDGVEKIIHYGWTVQVRVIFVKFCLKYIFLSLNSIFSTKNFKPNLENANVKFVCRLIHPVKFYRNYIAHEVRPDGREFESFRPIRINAKSIGTADGSAIVKLGSTTVICGIKAVRITSITKLECFVIRYNLLIMFNWNVKCYCRN